MENRRYNTNLDNIRKEAEAVVEFYELLMMQMIKCIIQKNTEVD